MANTAAPDGMAAYAPLARSCWLHASGASCSCFEVEVTLDGVAASELPAHPMLGHMHLVDRRFGDIGRRAGDGREDRVDQLGGPASSIGVGRHLRVEHLAHPQRAL